MSVHVEPVITELRAALLGHASLAAGDPAVEGAAAHLVAALEPAVRQVVFALAQQAAAEVAAQLPDRTVDVVLTDGDPALRLSEATGAARAPSSEEDFDARITLRLPPSLKRLIEDSASVDGDSVNSWVVDALSNRASRRANVGGQRVTEEFDL